MDTVESIPARNRRVSELLPRISPIIISIARGLLYRRSKAYYLGISTSQCSKDSRKQDDFRFSRPNSCQNDHNRFDTLLHCLRRTEWTSRRSHTCSHGKSPHLRSHCRNSSPSRLSNFPIRSHRSQPYTFPIESGTQQARSIDIFGMTDLIRRSHFLPMFFRKFLISIMQYHKSTYVPRKRYFGQPRVR